VRFPGILPAVTTPFDERGAVAVPALQRTVGRLLEAGVHGIVGTGTMGEAGSLSAAERRAVIEAIVSAAGGRVPVVAGVSAATPAVAAGFAADAAAAGADALMCLPPVGYRGDEREIEHHFRTVAEATGLPLMLYNNPEASGTDLLPPQIVRLADAVESLAAVKECSGDARRIPAILVAAEGRLEVLVGGDDWALEGFCAGATGWVSGVADVAPEASRALYDHCRAGDLPAAREVYRRLLPLARFDMTPKLVQYFKAALDALGEPGGPCRPTRLPLTDAERADLDAALATLREGALA
jgi:dihydrodipicolinate synthase/N-acetylneuraminate lyase